MPTEGELHYEVSVAGEVVVLGVIATVDADGEPVFQVQVPSLVIDSLGEQRIEDGNSTETVDLCVPTTTHAIPEFLSVIPTIGLLIVAIWTRQVLIALPARRVVCCWL